MLILRTPLISRFLHQIIHLNAFNLCKIQRKCQIVFDRRTFLLHTETLEIEFYQQFDSILQWNIIKLDNELESQFELETFTYVQSYFIWKIKFNFVWMCHCTVARKVDPDSFEHTFSRANYTLFFFFEIKATLLEQIALKLSKDFCLA